MRIEAKAARAKVPPDMRAEPYGFEDSGKPKQKTGFSNQFKNAGQAEPEEKSAKMSSSFNKASENNGPDNGPEPTGPSARPK